MFLNSKNAQDFCENIRIFRKMFRILRTMLVKTIKVHDFEKKFVCYFWVQLKKMFANSKNVHAFQEMS